MSTINPIFTNRYLEILLSLINGTLPSLTVSGTVTSNGLCLEPGDVCMLSGSFPIGTVFNITAQHLSPLQNENCAGTMTLYFENAPRMGIAMASFVKVNGVITQSLVYQTIGNMTSITMIPSNSEEDLTVIVSPAARLRWVFIGY